VSDTERIKVSRRVLPISVRCSPTRPARRGAPPSWRVVVA